MSHIVWLISMLYLLLFESDTVFKSKFFKSKFLNRSTILKVQFQPLLWLSLLMKCSVVSRLLFVDQSKVVLYYFRLNVY